MLFSTIAFLRSKLYSNLWRTNVTGFKLIPKNILDLIIEVGKCLGPICITFNETMNIYYTYYTHISNQTSLSNTFMF